ncbi:MAG: response regulator [Myxococcales bacterium]|nr:response regulator [Myxococcales bacterium]
MMWNPEDDDFEREEPTNPDHRSIRARVLVVEDDEDLRELIVARMRREGFDVVEAGSGFEALDVLTAAGRSQRPFEQLDLLVMDVRMPGTSGLEIARMLRAAEWPLPVVLITGFPDRELLLEASRLQLSLLAKPFALDRLSDTAIAALLAPPRHARA